MVWDLDRGFTIAVQSPFRQESGPFVLVLMLVLVIDANHRAGSITSTRTSTIRKGRYPD
jgi:hypothetical protein